MTSCEYGPLQTLQFEKEIRLGRMASRLETPRKGNKAGPEPAVALHFLGWGDSLAEVNYPTLAAFP